MSEHPIQAGSTVQSLKKILCGVAGISAVADPEIVERV